MQVEGEAEARNDRSARHPGEGHRARGGLSPLRLPVGEEVPGGRLGAQRRRRRVRPCGRPRRSCSTSSCWSCPRTRRPPRAWRRSTLAEVPLEGFDSFEIRFSDAGAVEKTTLVSPDLATCDDCARELFNPNDRRFPLPVHQLHELRPALHHHREAALRSQASTSMKDFPLCERCAAEYGDPLDRRFHAQPDACFRVRPAGELARARKPRRANMHRRANECFT